MERLRGLTPNSCSGTRHTPSEYCCNTREASSQMSGAAAPASPPDSPGSHRANFFTSAMAKKMNQESEGNKRRRAKTATLRVTHEVNVISRFEFASFKRSIFWFSTLYQRTFISPTLSTHIPAKSLFSPGAPDKPCSQARCFYRPDALNALCRQELSFSARRSRHTFQPHTIFASKNVFRNRATFRHRANSLQWRPRATQSNSFPPRPRARSGATRTRSVFSLRTRRLA